MWGWPWDFGSQLEASRAQSVLSINNICSKWIDCTTTSTPVYRTVHYTTVLTLHTVYTLCTARARIRALATVPHRRVWATWGTSRAQIKRAHSFLSVSYNVSISVASLVRLTFPLTCLAFEPSPPARAPNLQTLLKYGYTCFIWSGSRTWWGRPLTLLLELTYHFKSSACCHSLVLLNAPRYTGTYFHYYKSYCCKFALKLQQIRIPDQLKHIEKLKSKSAHIILEKSWYTVNLPSF